MRRMLLHPNTQQVAGYMVRGKRLPPCPQPYREWGKRFDNILINELHFHGYRNISRRLASICPQCIGADNHDNDILEGNEDSRSASIDLDLPRRSRQVTFTCNKCGGRTERLVNPVAWEKGMVIVQCEHCKAWHKIADAANMVEEYRYQDEE
eukprot:jgi/Picsp_1/1312/NSC_04793-R1_zinc ribbon 1